MLPNTFRYPATCAASNGDALSTCCRKARTLSRRLAAVDFFFLALCLRHFYRVIAEEANVFIAEVFGANDSLQHDPCQKLS